MTAQQLKNSILQMAVQGKLVPQDPNDEPASVLLERIRTEKERLIKEKKIKKEKNSSVIFRGSDNFPYADLPFDVPEGWGWVRLNDVAANIHYGYTASAQPTGNAKLLRITDIQNNVVCWRDVPFCEPTESEYATYGLSNRDIMIARTGGTIGKSYIVRSLEGRAVFASYLIRVIPLESVYEEYLKVFLETPFYWEQLKSYSMGTGQPNVNGQSLKKLVLPLPPLAEQRRIVARIEELLPHVADYAAAEQKLTALNAAFPGDLKKSILQAAVMGKLVPQDPDDEPASSLLERIRAEKEALIKAGKIKRDKRESVIFRRDNSHYTIRDGMEVCIDDDSPFEIPESWAWVHLGEICTVARGGSPRPIQEYLTSSENGINWIKIGDTDIGGKYINSTKQKIKPEGISKSRMVHRGDFLLTNSMSFGRPYILNVDGCIHDGWLVLSGYQATLDTDYFYYTLSSRFAYYQFCGQVSGAVVKNLNSDKVADSIFPLPPLAEQVRIVKRIDRLLGIIEKVPTA